MRNSARFPRVLPLLALAAAGAIAACSSGNSGPESVGLPAGHHTQQVRVSPVTAAGVPVSGYRVTSHASNASCSAGSEAIGQAYRCFAGNGVYDPCWAEKAATPTVLCVPDPWLHTAAALRVSSALSPIPNEGGGAGEPWGIQLSGGQRCVLAQGAHNIFDGKVIDYYCTSSLFLLRGLDLRPPTWTARSVLDKSGKLTSGPVRQIDVAWYGTPARFH